MKIRRLKFIKENTLFSWKLNETCICVQEEDSDLWKVELGQIYCSATCEWITDNIFIDELIRLGYAIWLDEEELEEKPLVEQVDELIDQIIVEHNKRWEPDIDLTKYDVIPSKYHCIELYDHIVKQLNKQENCRNDYYWYVNYNSKEKRFFVTGADKDNSLLILQGAYYDLICEAIIDSKKMRPYLEKIHDN